MAEQQPQDELIERFNQALRDRVRSREEVIMVRKLLAARLGQTLGEEQVRHPLSLVDPDAEISGSPDPQGLEGEFVEAARRYSSARKRLTKAREESRALMAEMKGVGSEKESKQQDTDQEIMDLHLEVTRLQKRYDHLRAVRRGLEDLQQLPAADPDFLNPEVMYSDCSPLPQMPKEMVDGFAVDHSATDARVEQLLQTLKKSVLRSKLVAQRAQRRHEEEQARDPLDPGSLPLEVKVQALKAVKDTLIDWIETQLSKTGDEALDATPRKQAGESASGAEYDHDAQMAQIQGKYQRHIELRKQILTLLTQKDQIKGPQAAGGSEARSATAVTTTAKTAAPAPAPTPPSAYLLTPYIERLQALAREQKAMVREKSHINASLARQQEEARQVLDHLAQESHLLPRYPMTAAASSNEPASFGEATRIGGKSDIVGQVQPWIYAADSAKIATLETVAEAVEEGMMSVDEARQALEQVCKLLNINVTGGDQTGAGGAEKDENEAIPSSPRKELRKKKDGPRNIWAILDGTLGSIQESNET